MAPEMRRQDSVLTPGKAGRGGYGCRRQNDNEPVLCSCTKEVYVVGGEGSEVGLG